MRWRHSHSGIANCIFDAGSDVLLPQSITGGPSEKIERGSSLDLGLLAGRNPNALLVVDQAGATSDRCNRKSGRLAIVEVIGGGCTNKIPEQVPLWSREGGDFEDTTYLGCRILTAAARMV